MIEAEASRTQASFSLSYMERPEYCKSDIEERVQTREPQLPTQHTFNYQEARAIDNSRENYSRHTLPTK